jgi:hypothetical protein
MLGCELGGPVTSLRPSEGEQSEKDAQATSAASEFILLFPDCKQFLKNGAGNNGPVLMVTFSWPLVGSENGGFPGEAAVAVESRCLRGFA